MRYAEVIVILHNLTLWNLNSLTEWEETTLELHLTVTYATSALEIVGCTGNIKELTSRNTVLSGLRNLISIYIESVIHYIPYSCSVEVEI